MEELITISTNLGSEEKPLIVHMGITKQAGDRMQEMFDKEPKPISNKRWNEIMFGKVFGFHQKL